MRALRSEPKQRDKWRRFVHLTFFLLRLSLSLLAARNAARPRFSTCVTTRHILHIAGAEPIHAGASFTSYLCRFGVCRLNIEKVSLYNKCLQSFAVGRMPLSPPYGNDLCSQSVSITRDPVNASDDGVAEASNRLTAGSKAAIHVPSRACPLHSGPATR